MMNSLRYLFAFLGLTAAAAVVGQEEDIDARVVIEARQAALRDMGEAFKAINDEMKRSSPSLAKIREHARRIEQLSKHQSKWFPEGTGQDADVINAAKDEIWDSPADFKAAQASMASAATKLVTIAAGADVAAIKKQAQALGKSCKGCHDRFREED